MPYINKQKFLIITVIFPWPFLLVQIKPASIFIILYISYFYRALNVIKIYDSEHKDS